MKSILVVDDDRRLTSLIVTFLKTHSYNAVGVNSSDQARSELNETHFDAIIIDWMMPDESGIDFIKWIRSSTSHIKDIPAIMLTAIGELDKKIVGFDSGFDDYLTKPFENKELIARLRAIMKRSPRDRNHNLIKFGNCEFNIGSNELRRGLDIVYLSSTETDLLKTLCQRPNQPFSRADLSKKMSFQVSDRTIDVQITRLRKKIGDDTKNPTIIKTIRHIGYAICCNYPQFRIRG
ncbi:MAG: response regulator transcription factor [Holosporales bacterium]|jgi:two-component system phosphate regulon response regulator OmpR|nr:response regulator transcription factor [Holosporales bacterium]